MILISEVMYPVNKPLKADMALPEAVQIILDSGYMGLPVLGEKDTVVGFLSEHDCIPFLLTGSYHSDNRSLVRDIMYPEPLCVSKHGNIVDLAELMSGKKPKVYPVLDDGKLVGIITRSHVMRELNNVFSEHRTVA